MIADKSKVFVTHSLTHSLTHSRHHSGCIAFKSISSAGSLSVTTVVSFTKLRCIYQYDLHWYQRNCVRAYWYIYNFYC